jgi:branched-chain amino acid transport system permease protein
MKMTRATTNKWITYAMVIAAFVIMQYMVETGNATRHLQRMLVPICIYVILAISLNITVGFLGELTLGHAGFMSVGAYAGCLFSIWAQSSMPAAVRFPLAMLIGGLMAAVFGVIIGVPVLRLRGDYLAIVTLAFGEIIRSVIINLEFTGGASGLKGTPRDSTFVIAFAVVLITMFVAINLMNSKHGRAIMAIRDNRIAAEGTGINLTRYKLMGFVVASFFAGVAGVLYGHNLSVLQASNFGYNKSIEILVIVVLGGLGSIRGSIIAAVVIYVLPESLRFLSEYRMLIYSVVLIAMMLLNASPHAAALKARISWRAIARRISGRRAV